MSDLLACQGCDLLIDISELQENCTARCPRCDLFLTRQRPDAITRVLAYTCAAAILLVIANCFSFMSLAAGGLESAMTLPETALELFRYGMPYLAVLVGAFIIVIPALIVLLLLGVSLPLYRGRSSRWLKFSAHWIFVIYNWSMVEVFTIGVIVSLVKLTSLASIELGISFWAYAAFSVCFSLALGTLDRFQCWQMIEQLETR